MKTQKSTQATKNVQAIAENFTDTEGKSLKQLSDEFEEKSAQQESPMQPIASVTKSQAEIDAENEARIQAEVAKRVYAFTHAQEIAAQEKAAARSARLAEIEAARNEAERIRLEKVQAESAKRESLLLANPVIDTAMYFYSPFQRTRSATSTSKREPSVGDIHMKNGVTAKPYSEWKVRVQPSDDQILDIVRRVRAGESKSSVARLYNINPTYVAHIMKGEAKSWLTGIVPVSK